MATYCEASRTSMASETWETVKDVMEKVRGNKNRSTGADSPMVDKKEVEKSFWLNRPDGWVINRSNGS